MEPCDLKDIAAESIARQRALLGDDSRHTFALDAPDGPVLVPAERNRIEQVVANLLSNAVKYSPRGGVALSITRDEGAARLRVSNQGIGMPAQDLPNLFTPFHRGSNASTRNFAGIGLGLYLSKEVLDAHSCTLDVESWESIGTAVTMTLPLAGGGVDARGPDDPDRG